MSNLISLSQYLLKIIYSYLNLRDKFTFSFLNKEFHSIFYYNCPLLDTVFDVDHFKGYPKGRFLFENVISLSVSSVKIDNGYLSLFDKLEEVNLTCVQFTNFASAKTLVYRLPKSVSSVIIEDNSVKGLFDLVKHIHERLFSVTIFGAKKRKLEDSASLIVSNKRPRTPSPVSDFYEKQLEALVRRKNRLKYIKLYPEEFVPSEIFQKFTELSCNYGAVVDEYPFKNNLSEQPSEEEVENFIEELKTLSIHSFVRSRENNWIFITQVEAYYHSKQIDDVTQYNAKNKYPEAFSINIEKCEEGKGVWYELRFRYRKVEMIVTGGLYQKKDSKSNLGAFLGVSLPSSLSHNTELILLSPISPADTLACVRMLRNYKKSASLRTWCYKSPFFSSINFATPDQLQLYEQDVNGYICACSKLLRLSVLKELREADFGALDSMLDKTKFWKKLGFNEVPSKDDILKKLEDTNKPKISKAKQMLISIILRRQVAVNDRSLMLLYNGFISPIVKSINTKLIKEMEK